MHPQTLTEHLSCVMYKGGCWTTHICLISLLEQEGGPEILPRLGCSEQGVAWNCGAGPQLWQQV